jgi:hypothetical protein
VAGGAISNPSPPEKPSKKDSIMERLKARTEAIKKGTDAK